jgi:hypothetical protein
MEHPTFYRTTRIDGLSIFYREAGPGHVKIRVQACGVRQREVVTNFARGLPGQFAPTWWRVTASPARCGLDALRHRQSEEYLRDRRVPSRLE